MPDVVIVEAALNGGRSLDEHPGVPLTAGELAAEARRCADAGASVVHVHARGRDGGWTASVAGNQRVIQAVRAAVPDVLISITSLRPEGAPSEQVQTLLRRLPQDARPDLMSVNLGHITTWESRSGRASRETRQFPNSYDDIVLLLDACRKAGVIPELGLMDFGFISNAVSLRDDDILPSSSWFLLELDSPAFGAGAQVAPATDSTFAALSSTLRVEFPNAPWAAHGAGVATYAVVKRALEEGAHVRVGFEDCVQMPDGTLARSNADQVAWVAQRAEELGRRPATAAETWAVIAGNAWSS